MKEPTRYSMATGLPVEPTIKKHSLSSRNNEKEFWDFIAKHEEARKNWKKISENNKKSDQT